ncbi:MAG: hypothetical protein KBF89_07200 [Acidimicrobiia bacterium]|nr:hypothetical protein [Acidimicrobiia bacterium]
MEIDFLNIPFENDAHIIFDNDGVLSSLIPDWNTSSPNEKTLRGIKAILRKNPRSKVSVLTGRLTTFLNSRIGFQSLINTYPDQVTFYGFYGNQKYNPITDPEHSVIEKLDEYKELIPKLLSLLEQGLDEILTELNKISLNGESPMNIDLLKQLVIEDKAFGLGIHIRHLLNHMGLINKDNSDQEIENRNKVIKLVNDVVSEIVAALNFANPTLPFKIKSGSLISEIFPASGINDDKVERFLQIYNDHLQRNDCPIIYYFGDDLGDAKINNFCYSNRDNNYAPKTVFIFVDSSPDDYDPTRVRMREQADFVVSPNDLHNATEVLSNIIVHKASLAISHGIEI